MEKSQPNPMSQNLIQTEFNLNESQLYIPMVVCSKSESTERLDFIHLRPARDGEKPQYYKRKKDDDK